jgi:hypothetical protein
MKKLLIILLIALSFNASSQSKNNYEGHAMMGAVIGFGSQTFISTNLSKYTRIHPTWCKIIGTVSSIVITNSCAIGWEKYSGGVYNENDIKWTNYGGLFGTGAGVLLTWNMYPEWYVNEKEIKNDPYEYNPELTLKSNK